MFDFQAITDLGAITRGVAARGWESGAATKELRWRDGVSGPFTLTMYVLVVLSAGASLGSSQFYHGPAKKGLTPCARPPHNAHLALVTAGLLSVAFIRISPSWRTTFHQSPRMAPIGRWAGKDGRGVRAKVARLGIVSVQGPAFAAWGSWSSILVPWRKPFVSFWVIAVVHAEDVDVLA